MPSIFCYVFALQLKDFIIFNGLVTERREQAPDNNAVQANQVHANQIPLIQNNQNNQQVNNNGYQLPPPLRPENTDDWTDM